MSDRHATPDESAQAHAQGQKDFGNKPYDGPYTGIANDLGMNNGEPYKGELNQAYSDGWQNAKDQSR
jgi:hypothetical protein